MLVTGGAGYVGSVLVPKLLADGHAVRVLDTYWFGDDVARRRQGPPEPDRDQGDMRDRAVARTSAPGCTAVIHLACISNDPSFELDPTLGKSINYDAFLPLVQAVEEARRAAVHLRLVVERLRHQGRGERDRGTAAEAADGLLEVQGDVRGGAGSRARAGLHRAHAAPRDRVRLLAAAAARPVGEHPHEPRVPQAARSPSSAASSAGRTCTSRT